MATTAIHRLTLDPMGKCSNAFYSETTNMIKARGPSNDHSWAVWFQLSKWFQRRSILKHFSHRFSVFYGGRKSKMVATAGHRLTLDPMGKYSNAFFSETTNIIKAKLYMNVHWQFGFNCSSGFREEAF
jgi:hypothetical protein